ncbi:hypothetical protein CK203_026344 [Vitis vinifera]|uniref:Uncharacterized protein n=1 Tax=Vitis vinifera TaxID=29760 RepID=A0A438IKZ6_VITVI|nr:hypothetical protein CK203_026344 [Vitis vinifera]
MKFGGDCFFSLVSSSLPFSWNFLDRVNCGVFGVDLSFKLGLEPVSNGERRRWSMRVPSNKRADWRRKTGEFELTAFFVMDLQSYLSHLSLFLAPESNKFYVLVDNQPWLREIVSRPAHIWQLMVTKSRLSPFANKARRERKEPKEMLELKGGSKSKNSKSENFQKWFTLIDAATLSLAWKDVRGINYLNELQTDTSLAIEAKFMKRWEFDSIAQAAEHISSWFPGTHGDRHLLKEYLDSAIGEVFYDAEEDFLPTSPIDDNENNVCDEDNAHHNLSSDFSVYPVSMENRTAVDSMNHSETFCKNDCESAIEPTEYWDSPGLPSWVIFLQSYPGFCHLYRPWMCPLARALYVFISLVTVLIGFYDLYKNVPVLKATASRLCGPLFDWIESWEMISRIRYLGTMLFLHNFQKAVKWFLMMTRTTRSFISVLTQPMAEPFMELLGFILPLWNMCVQIVESFGSSVWILIDSSWNLVDDIVIVLLSPIWFILSVLWSIATSIIYPIFWVLWEILYAPIRLVLLFSNFIAFICSFICDVLGEIWQSLSGLCQLGSASRTALSTSEVSMWRSLWNDLFSQVFRAVRSILNGFVAFFTACNRHRLRSSSKNYMAHPKGQGLQILDIVDEHVEAEIRFIGPQGKLTLSILIFMGNGSNSSYEL